MSIQRIHFDTANLIRVAFVVLLGFAVWRIFDFVIVLAVALVVSTFIEDFVKRGRKHRIPRAVSVILFYLISILLFLGILVFLIPALAQEVDLLARIYPEIQTVINLDVLNDAAGGAYNVQDVLAQISQVSFGDVLLKNLSLFFGGILNVVFIFIFSFYLSIQEGSFDKLLRIFTPLHHEEKVLDLWRRTQLKIGSWFRGQLIIALALTILTYIGLSLFGVPYAFLLSLLAGLFGLIPYGILIALIPALLMGFSEGGIGMLLLILGFYALLQQILDYILQPIILRKLTGIPSLLVILSVVIGAKLFGFFGLILAVPVTLFILECVEDREKRRMRERHNLFSPRKHHE